MDTYPLHAFVYPNGHIFFLTTDGNATSFSRCFIPVYDLIRPDNLGNLVAKLRPKVQLSLSEILVGNLLTLN